jgi:UDP-GlcNAc:undecaprenyl-phosphate GlcNAc-1-phosphate transferase
MQAVTVLWIVLITNSFNLLDNMDGLCSGTVAIAAAMLALVALDSHQWTMMLILAALCGSSLGFLRYNRSPATIFLGDGGSLLVGYLMACSTSLVTYYRPSLPSHLAIGIPVLVLAIPLYDTFSVILIRLREGRPIMRGDTSHFSHRLVDLGMTRGQAVTTIHLACLAIGLPATALGQLSEERGLLIVCQALLVLTIVALLERAGRNRAMSRAQNSPTQPLSSESARLQEKPSPLSLTGDASKAYETEDVHKER